MDEDPEQQQKYNNNTTNSNDDDSDLTEHIENAQMEQADRATKGGNVQNFPLA